MAREVDDTKARLRRKRKSLNEGNRVSKCSLEKAASILNMTETDLVDMLETDEVSVDYDVDKKLRGKSSRSYR